MTRSRPRPSHAPSGMETRIARFLPLVGMLCCIAAALVAFLGGGIIAGLAMVALTLLLLASRVFLPILSLMRPSRRWIAGGCLLILFLATLPDQAWQRGQDRVTGRDSDKEVLDAYMAAERMQRSTAMNQKLASDAIAAVSALMIDPDSAEFRAMRSHEMEGMRIVCGLVHGRDAQGRYPPFSRFIYFAGQPMLDNGAPSFNQLWQRGCTKTKPTID